MKKNTKVYLINIILSISILTFVLFLSKTYPFGNRLLGKSDAIVQFKPMLYNFIMKMKTGTLLNYSFNNGLGNPFTFDFIYYLSSPINLIALLFNNYNDMYLSVIIIKIVIATISITFYIKKKTNNTIITIITCLSYVFSAWFLTYYYYIPWLDVFMIFPLFQYGLELLLEKNKYHIYILSLSYMMATNFYLCFSVCIYTILYFIIYVLLYKKETIRHKINSFNYITLSTLFSFLIVFFYLYIIYDIILKTGIFFEDQVLIKYKVDFFSFIKSLLYPNSILTIENEYTFPNLSCSILLLFPFFHFFINKSINKRTKIFTLLSILFATLIIFIPKLNFLFNAFHNIRGLTYRYSFIMILLYIKIILYDLNNYSKDNIKEYCYSMIPIILLYVMSIKKFEPSQLIISITFFICYIIILLFKLNNKSFKTLLLIVFCIEITTAASIHMPSKDATKEIHSSFNKTNSSYRLSQMGIKNEYTNANLYLNKKAIYIMTSLTYNKAIILFKSIGCKTFENTYSTCYKNEKITNLLFNIKSDNSNLYLEKIYSVNKDINNTFINEYDVKSTQENIISNMTKIDNIFDKKTINGQLINNKYIYNIDEDYYIIENGNNTYLETSNKISSKNNINSLNIYTTNNKKLDKVYKYLSKNQIKYSYYNDNHIKGTINVDKNQLIFTSIPYDKDWIVKIDDKKVKPIEILDSLIGIETTPGKHKIELEYKTHYTIPALISIGSFILLIIDIIRKRKQS